MHQPLSKSNVLMLTGLRPPTPCARGWSSSNTPLVLARSSRPIERLARIPGQGHLPPTLLRLSMGTEAVDYLWTDLDQTLRNVPQL
jgi:hypothetical protein